MFWRMTIRDGTCKAFICGPEAAKWQRRCGVPAFCGRLWGPVLSVRHVWVSASVRRRMRKLMSHMFWLSVFEVRVRSTKTGYDGLIDAGG